MSLHILICAMCFQEEKIGQVKTIEKEKKRLAAKIKELNQQIVDLEALLGKLLCSNLLYLH